MSKDRKTQWQVITYDTSQKLMPSGKGDRFIMFDSKEGKNTSVNIYCFSFPLRKSDLDTIEGEIKGSKQYDLGILIIPHEHISKIQEMFESIFGESLCESQSETIKGYSQIYFDELKKIAEETPDDVILRTYRFEEDEMVENKLFDLLTNAQLFTDWYEKLSHEDRSKVDNTLVYAGTSGYTSDSDYVKTINNVFQRINSVTNVLVDEGDLKKVLGRIADGIVKVFGNENVAVGIDAFDERMRGGDGDFIRSTYTLRGGDKQQKGFMRKPFRIEGSAGDAFKSAMFQPPRNRSFFIEEILKDWPPSWKKLRFMLEGREPDVASVAYFPLMIGKLRVGMAVAQFSEPHKFTHIEKQELNLYAKVASSVLYNVMVREQLTYSPTSSGERLKPGLEAVQNITNSFKTNPDISWSELLKAVSEQIMIIYQPKNFFIARYDSENEILYYDTILISGQQITLSPQKVEDGITERVLKSGNPIFIPNSVIDYMNREKMQIPIANKPPQCYLGIPIISEGKTWGIIAMQDFDNPDVYDENDKMIILSLANIIGIAFSSPPEVN